MKKETVKKAARYLKKCELERQKFNGFLNIKMHSAQESFKVAEK